MNTAQIEVSQKENNKSGNGNKPHTVDILVNEVEVEMPFKTATGLEIKVAAMQQGVHIQENFVLQEELPNGKSKVVGDNDQVKLHQKQSFTAIAPDDNS